MWVMHQKSPNQAKEVINMVTVNLEVLWIVSDRIVHFLFFVKFHKSWTAIIFSFWTLTEHVSYASKELLIKQKTSSTWWVYTLEGLWMVSHRIVEFQFFVKNYRSGPKTIFCFWTLIKHVSYASKKHLIKQETSSTWWVILWKDYGWFLIEFSFFDSSSNFTGPDL